MSDDERNRTYFALGFLWATLILIVLAIIGLVWVPGSIGILQPDWLKLRHCRRMTLVDTASGAR